MAVPPEFIEDLRQRVPLSDVVGRGLNLFVKGAATADYARSTLKNTLFFGGR